MNLIKTELTKTIQEAKTYYPDFIVSVVGSIILFSFLINSGYSDSSNAINYIFWMLVSGVMGEASVSISMEKQMGTLQNLLIKPYSILRILVAKTISWFILNIVKSSFVLFIIFLFWGTYVSISPTIILILLISSTGVLGIALLLASLTMIYTKVASFESILSYLLLFLSGNFKGIPMVVKISNPFSYGIFLIEKSVKDAIGIGEIGMLIMVSIVWLGVGVMVFKKIYNDAKGFSWTY